MTAPMGRGTIERLAIRGGLSMVPRITRRRFVVASVLGAVGAGAYGLTRAVRNVREAARRLSDD
jgi:hypothetical protein